jgi:hypothetical protein
MSNDPLDHIEELIIILGALAMIAQRRRGGRPRKPAEVQATITDRNIVARDVGFEITGVVFVALSAEVLIFFNQRIRPSITAADFAGFEIDSTPGVGVVASVTAQSDRWARVVMDEAVEAPGVWNLLPNNVRLSGDGLATVEQSDVLVDFTPP